MAKSQEKMKTLTHEQAVEESKKYLVKAESYHQETPYSAPTVDLYLQFSQAFSLLAEALSPNKVSPPDDYVVTNNQESLDEERVKHLAREVVQEINRSNRVAKTGPK